MASDISFSCAAAARVDKAAAAKVCGEFLAYLGAAHPNHRFATDGTGLPRIKVTVTAANERSLGFEIGWVAANGTASAGTPLHRAFYDRNADAELRRRFYRSFLDINPLPF